MPLDADELTVINGPPVHPPTKRIGYPTTEQRRKMGVKSLQRDLKRSIQRWDWFFQMRWTQTVVNTPMEATNATLQSSSP